ncbi:unnamed protein product [Enterobius vermicularis]|uniref:SCHIP-1 domain-containing protein n=1 Tax=Enterobius vermicularis TaxID=51028 RepID=A0A0N4UV85_ENTVE|nr:unnamed protein product [Enterobius vermicularis]
MRNIHYFAQIPLIWTCCICLECCVDHHNGHDLRRLIRSADPGQDSSSRCKTRDSVTQTPLLFKKFEPDVSSLPGLWRPMQATSEPNSRSSLSGSHGPSFQRRKLRSESFVSNLMKNLPHKSQPTGFHEDKQPRSYQNLDSVTNIFTVCVENMNYSKRLDSGISSSLSSDDTLNFPKANKSSKVMSVEYREDDHIPNMPRRKHSRGGSAAMRRVEAAEADTDVEDELLPILKRTMSKGLNAEAVVLEKDIENARCQRSSSLEDNRLIVNDKEQERCHSYENIKNF